MPTPFHPPVEVSGVSSLDDVTSVEPIVDSATGVELPVDSVTALAVESVTGVAVTVDSVGVDPVTVDSDVLPVEMGDDSKSPEPSSSSVVVVTSCLACTTGRLKYWDASI